MHVYRWRSKNNGPLYRIETINICVWLQLARMKMDSNLKIAGRFFSSFCSCGSGKNIQKLILARFFFQNSFHFVSLVA